MEKTEKGPTSSFILENLSELETVHQYIQGKNNTLPDSCSRYPMLGPKRLATRGLASSVAEMLRRIPSRLKGASLVHFHGGKQSAELRETLKDWFSNVSTLQLVTPPSKAAPPTADFVVLLPRLNLSLSVGTLHKRSLFPAMSKRHSELLQLYNNTEVMCLLPLPSPSS